MNDMAKNANHSDIERGAKQLGLRGSAVELFTQICVCRRPIIRYRSQGSDVIRLGR